MDAHISRDGWTSMNGTARSGAKTDVFLPQDARFFESGSHGPGAQRKNIGIKWQEHPRMRRSVESCSKVGQIRDIDPVRRNLRTPDAGLLTWPQGRRNGRRRHP